MWVFASELPVLTKYLAEQLHAGPFSQDADFLQINLSSCPAVFQVEANAQTYNAVTRYRLAVYQEDIPDLVHKFVAAALALLGDQATTRVGKTFMLDSQGDVTDGKGIKITADSIACKYTSVGIQSNLAAAFGNYFIKCVTHALNGIPSNMFLRNGTVPRNLYYTPFPDELPHHDQMPTYLLHLSDPATPYFLSGKSIGPAFRTPLGLSFHGTDVLHIESSSPLLEGNVARDRFLISLKCFPPCLPH